MASLVSGIEFLDKFGAYRVIFPFFLILAISYGILSKTKLFGENKGLCSLVSIVIAFFFVLSARAVTFISILIPFIIIFMIILFFIMFVTSSTGVSLEQISKGVSKGGWFIILLVLLIISFTVLNLTFPEFNPETRDQINDTGDSTKALDVLGGITDMFFTPAVIGLIVLFMVFAIAAYVITMNNK